MAALEELLFSTREELGRMRQQVDRLEAEAAESRTAVAKGEEGSSVASLALVVRSMRELQDKVHDMEKRGRTDRDAITTLVDKVGVAFSHIADVAPTVVLLTRATPLCRCATTQSAVRACGRLWTSCAHPSPRCGTRTPR
jgi:hypothetical protein